MNTLRQMVQDSTLTRLFANIFLFVLIVGSAFLVGWQVFTRQTPDPWLVGIASVGVGSSIKILGISAGIAMTNEEKQP